LRYQIFFKNKYLPFCRLTGDVGGTPAWLLQQQVREPLSGADFRCLCAGMARACCRMEQMKILLSRTGLTLGAIAAVVAALALYAFVGASSAYACAGGNVNQNFNSNFNSNFNFNSNTNVNGNSNSNSNSNSSTTSLRVSVTS
ncbi:MAG: hypothetical protein WD034_02275, partial [Parvibaculum sp.]|uniref:hypothetical protein n=1 Tax=Parvibaculum sp. TaxID=2024848 RepID=UPI0034A0267A